MIGTLSAVPIQQVVKPIGHHQLMLLFLQLFVLLLVARVLGVLATRINLPEVVGQLLAGIVVGPSILGVIAPGLLSSLFPFAPDQFHLLGVVSWIGLLMLLVLTGIETDLDLIASKASSATLIAITGVVIPFVFGFGLGWVLPGRFLTDPSERLVFSLFVATAMSISSIPVIGKVLIDMDIVRRDIGQITLASGMINDSLGWILLAVVAGLARSGVIDLAAAAETIIVLLLFLALSFTVGRRLSKRLVQYVDNAIGGDMAKITTLMVVTFGLAALTQYLGIEAFLGAFVAGILFGDVKRFDRRAQHIFEVVTMGVFAPIFFAIAGLRVNLAALTDPTVLLAAIGALIVAIVGKFVGTYVGARAAGFSTWENISLGAGMNARGAVEIIVAIIGVSVGVLTGEMYTIIVTMAIITSIMAPPLLRWTVPRIEMSDEERERLEREADREGSFVANIKRILIPTRGSVDSQFAAHLVGCMVRGEDIEVTNMYLGRGEGQRATFRTNPIGWTRRLLPDGGQSDDDSQRTSEDPPTPSQETVLDSNGGEDEDMIDETPPPADDPDRCFEVMENHLTLEEPATRRNIIREEQTSATETVLAETEQGYDLLTLGASERGARLNDQLFSAELDSIITNASCPVMIVNAHEEQAKHHLSTETETINRILLPTAGTEYNRHAAEIAFAIARNRNARVDILHYVNPPQQVDQYIDQPDLQSLVEVGEEIVDQAADRGRRMGAEVNTRVLVAEDEPQEEILGLVEDDGYDLVMMGTSTRPVTQRAFLGPRVEYIIRNAPCPVAVLSSP
jgi:Kef-type K+ transport system membrane component KefB/nucleotide-binding universal stress UspA family protein